MGRLCLISRPSFASPFTAAMKLFNAALFAAAALPFAASLSTIVRKGSFLFDSSTGDRFYLKGLAYAANYDPARRRPPAKSARSTRSPTAPAAPVTSRISSSSMSTSFVSTRSTLVSTTAAA